MATLQAVACQPLELVGVPASSPRIVSITGVNGWWLVGGIGRHESSWLMAYIRGPEGIFVSLAERID